MRNTDSIVVLKDNLKDSITIENNLSEKAEIVKVDKINSKPATENKNNTEVRIFRNSDSNSFGYDILLDGRVYIHQPNVPARPGNEGFISEEQAKRVAQFVITKIEMKILLPTISINELDSLGIK